VCSSPGVTAQNKGRLAPYISYMEEIDNGN
jgi:hypothetical protein